jgi:hypothetical protein
MTLDDLPEQLRAATDQAGRWRVLKSFLADRASQPKPPIKMPTPGKRRASLTELRPHHLATVEHIASRRHYITSPPSNISRVGVTTIGLHSTSSRSRIGIESLVAG